MESFSLLKYWRGGGRGGGLATSVSLPTMPPHGPATLGATVLRCAAEAAPGEYGDVDDDDRGGDDDDCSSSTSAGCCDDEGPFFDLEFAVPDDEDDDSSSSGVVGVMDGSEDGGEVVRAGAEFGFAVEAAASSSTQSDGLSPSPSHDDLFFKGRLVPLETASSATATTTSLVLAEPNSRQHQFMPVSTLLKSATRFRVFALGLKKGTGAGGGSSNNSGVAKPSGGVEPSATVAAPSPKHPQQHGSSKFFTVKYLKVVEEVPIMSLFTRDNSSRSSNKTTTATAARQSSSSDLESTISSSCASSGAASCGSSAAASDEKKSSKELVHKYLNKIKPRRHADKLEQQHLVRSSPGRQQAKTPPAAAAASTAPDAVEAAKDSVDSSTPPVVDTAAGGGDQKLQAAGAVPTPDASGSEKQLHALSTAAHKPTTTTQKEKVVASVSASAASQHLQAGLRVVCKHLGKSRSASAAVAATPSPPPATATRRRDDSLLQQQDGIQSAIAHCKRSFNATRADNNLPTCSPPPPPTTAMGSADLLPAPPLARSRSDPYDEQRCSSGGVEMVA